MKIIYPGTFDPFSLGHTNITARACAMYECVIIAVSENIYKKPMFTLEQRVEMAKLAVADIRNTEVIGFKGLLVDLMQEKGVHCVLRGIRGMVDFEYELQMAQANRSMLKGYEPIFLMPGENYMALSSAFIRDLLRHGGNVSPFLPKPVNEYIKQFYDRI
ncbi:MAG: pantetheine-phosphate adenylyltransferase [Deferribacteraceae bacterium]|jgi:pantetheine-phosphate adenylyltransferase|nr:pantetheine-phosphate adenylyltransferase [Deferribacteraceae bacterium]